MVGRKKKLTTVYLTAEQDEDLRRLHAATQVPIAVLIREGVDLMLEKRKHQLNVAEDGDPVP